MLQAHTVFCGAVTTNSDSVFSWNYWWRYTCWNIKQTAFFTITMVHATLRFYNAWNCGNLSYISVTRIYYGRIAPYSAALKSKPVVRHDTKLVLHCNLTIYLPKNHLDAISLISSSFSKWTFPIVLCTCLT
jgi:hypothetical protein